MMHSLSDPNFWASWARIVVIDLLLAGDNALVIALAVRRLAPREQLWGRVMGTVGAVVLRLLFIALVTLLLKVPLLRLAGGLLLVWVALKLVREDPRVEDAVEPGTTLRQAIGIIILADVVMSLDNVVAIAAAARGDLVLVTFGLLLSIPIVVWGSGFLAGLMNRMPILVWAGSGVLGWVAMNMVLDDPLVANWLGGRLARIHSLAPGLAAVAITLLGWHFARRAARDGPR
jgi:YjbE family integral membrane protein